jgi:hypothetical protein
LNNKTTWHSSNWSYKWFSLQKCENYNMEGQKREEKGREERRGKRGRRKRREGDRFGKVQRCDKGMRERVGRERKGGE